jgi:hypothetical protein
MVETHGALQRLDIKANQVSHSSELRIARQCARKKHAASRRVSLHLLPSSPPPFLHHLQLSSAWRLVQVEEKLHEPSGGTSRGPPPAERAFTYLTIWSRICAPGRG